jgi:predicted Rossmann-fold nucleotide-binding protein
MPVSPTFTSSIQHKPCGVLNVDGYYDALLQMADRAVAEGFVREAHRALLVSGSDPANLLDRMGVSRQQ